MEKLHPNLEIPFQTTFATVKQIEHVIGTYARRGLLDLYSSVTCDCTEHGCIRMPVPPVGACFGERFQKNQITHRRKSWGYRQ